MANCDLDVTPDTDLLQDGADAVGLYVADGTDFPNGTAATATNLLDAIVYDVNQADDSGLLATLLTGGDQVNEDGAGAGGSHSMQRLPNGTGDARDTGAYATDLPTPGAVNVNTPPTVSSIVRADANPTAAGSVNFTVTFSENVTGVDTEDFTLNTTGTAGGSVNSVSGSGTTWTVTLNGITGNGTLGLNLTDDDSIKNSLLFPLGGTGPGNGNFTGQIYDVDRVAPTVSNVTSTAADGTYYLGETIDISVQFSEVVTVTGVPQITLDTGGAGFAVNYSSGSGTNTLFFTYTVLEDHNCADLDYFNNKALSAGGGIVDGVGNDGVLTLAAPGTASSLSFNKNLVVDGSSRQSDQFPWLIFIPALVSPNKNIDE